MTCLFWEITRRIRTTQTAVKKMSDKYSKLKGWSSFYCTEGRGASCDSHFYCSEECRNKADMQRCLVEESEEKWTWSAGKIKRRAPGENMVYAFTYCFLLSSCAAAREGSLWGTGSSEVSEETLLGYYYYYHYCIYVTYPLVHTCAVRLFAFIALLACFVSSTRTLAEDGGWTGGGKWESIALRKMRNVLLPLHWFSAPWGNGPDVGGSDLTHRTDLIRSTPVVQPPYMCKNNLFFNSSLDWNECKNKNLTFNSSLTLWLFYSPSHTYLWVFFRSGHTSALISSAVVG